MLKSQQVLSLQAQQFLTNFQSKSNLSVPLHLSALFHLIKISIEVDLKNLTASETVLALQ